MTRRDPARAAHRAADTLARWLEGRSSVADATPQLRPASTGDAIASPTLPESERPSPLHPASTSTTGQAVAPAHTDWLYHHLTVTGPAPDLDAFRRGAAGAGSVPWMLDLDRMEEDFFLMLAAPRAGQVRSLSLEAARMLAVELRDAVARRHALAIARVGRSTACPLDLHALVPVPPDVLRLGPDHPDALRWLWEHWGTTEPLRSVSSRSQASVRRGREKRAADPEFAVTFWSADWTPWRALERVRADWPALRVDIRPVYDLP